MFIDSVKIYVKAGSGGKGCASIYRDRYTRHGIPDGGDGGKGADIIIRVTKHLRTLLDLNYKRHFFGLHGGHGSSKKKKGRVAPAVVIQVPIGTIIKDARTDCTLRDLDKDGAEIIVAHGGRGGFGSHHHRLATAGEPGEEKELFLDLKLIADVGVVGFPNAGKSTLVSSISAARPKIAPYPFTTIAPTLGVVSFGEGEPFVIADIPGLIEGSSEGRGIGDRFLRHVERTKLLVHLIDMASSEGRDPVEDYRIIIRELKNYSEAVYKKPQILAANKMDLEGAQGQLARFRKLVKKKIYPISALNRQGLEALVEAIRKKL